MKLQEYSISIILSRNNFLVDIVKDKKLGRILKLDFIKGKAWKGFDMLIFNTWHWWLHRGRHQPYVTTAIYVIRSIYLKERLFINCSHLRIVK